jgi:hypothetical protein
MEWQRRLVMNCATGLSISIIVLVYNYIFSSN